MRTASGLIILCALTACGVPKETGQTTIQVTQDRVTLAGPRGFCVEPSATRASLDEAFVIFGNCAAITGSPDEEQPDVPAIATASVTSSGLSGASIEGSVKQLQAFLASDEGRRTLSRSGNPDTIEVIDSFAANGALFLHAKDTSPSILRGAANTYWRAYFDVRSSIVTISILGFQTIPLSSDDGLETLKGFAARIQSQPDPVGQPSANPKSKTKGLFGRLFR